MMSSNSFNSSYQFADSLCYTASVTPTGRLSRSFPSQVRPITYGRKNYRRSYGWTSETDQDMDVRSKRQSSSFLGSSYSNLNYINYDSDSESDSDVDSRYDSDSNSTLNNDTIPSPSVLSESTIYSSTFCSSTDNSIKNCVSPKPRMVSFSDEVDIIKPPMIVETTNKKNLLKKAIKIIKIKKKDSN